MNDQLNTYNVKSYRFLSFDGLISTIEKKSLRFTRIDCLNDPLDNSPYLAPFDWKKFYSKENFGFHKFVNSYITNLFRNLYICCFCKEYNTEESYLMWSHYGKSHTQVCFEIDFSINKYLGNPSEVIYPRSLVEKRNKISITEKRDVGLFFVTNKSKIWSYEKEVRLIVDINNESVNAEGFILSDDQLHLYVKFDPKLISKIIFGIKSEEDDVLKVLKLLNEMNLNPILEKMQINPITLELENIELVNK